MAQAPATSYYIPHHGLGAIQSIPVRPATDHDQDKLVPNPTLAKEFTAILRPQRGGRLGVFREQPADSNDNDSAVNNDNNANEPTTSQSANALIGTVSPADRAEYPELDLILNAGLYPAVTAKPTDSGIVLRLPRPGLCLPANNPPSTEWVLLGHGPMLRVDNIAEDSGIDPAGRAHLLVTLKQTPHKKTNSQDTGNQAANLEVYLGNHYLATLDDAPSSLIDTVNDNEKEGVTTLAHALHSPRHGHRELDIFAGDPNSTGAGPEWQLARATPRSASAAQTFETSSFRAITEAEVAALDKVPTTATIQDSAPKSPIVANHLSAILGWVAIAIGVVALIFIAVLVF